MASVPDVPPDRCDVDLAPPDIGRPTARATDSSSSAASIALVAFVPLDRCNVDLATVRGDIRMMRLGDVLIAPRSGDAKHRLLFLLHMVIIIVIIAVIKRPRCCISSRTITNV